MVQVTMPQMGVSVAEGTIIDWRKRPGDWVEADEMICDITTDKVDVEIPSPAGGRLARILARSGETVAVGAVLAEIDAAAKPGEAHPEEETPGAEETTAEVDRSRFYSPVVRRMADKHDIDLAQVEGTGIGGRIRKKDLLDYIEAHDAAPVRSGAGAGPETESEPELHTESPYRPEDAATAPGDGAKTADVFAAGRREPLSLMRQQIGRHMMESRRTAAHCTTVAEVDMSLVAKRRRKLREQMARRGAPLTYLAFVARATVGALQEQPVLNASVDGEDIVYHDDVNLGIAVALDDGLIVPVIRRAQRLSLEGTAAAIADLAGRAREKRLEPDEVHGGTFTITNPGQFGSMLATPIIHQPQVAILDLEAVVKRPVVVEEPSGDVLAIRPITYLCLSWDHRALDGVQAARFLAAVRERLEGWEADA